MTIIISPPGPSTDAMVVFLLQKELFVRAVSTKSIRLFLEWFTETQMFEVFMTEKLESPNFNEGETFLLMSL